MMFELESLMLTCDLVLVGGQIEALKAEEDCLVFWPYDAGGRLDNEHSLCFVLTHLALNDARRAHCSGAFSKKKSSSFETVVLRDLRIDACPVPARY